MILSPLGRSAMRPVEFTQQEIITAGQALRDAGRNVTGFALRQKVGGGNPNRLKQVWDEYLASQSTARAQPVAELPVEVAEEMAIVTQELSKRIAALAIELNDKAVKAAERRVAEVVRSAGEQRDQAERELADASQTVEDLEAAIDAAKAATEALEARLGEAQSKLQAQAIELAKLAEKLTGAEQTQEALARAEHDRDEARASAGKAREEAAALRGRLEAVETQNAELLRVLSERPVGGKGSKG